MFCTFLQRNNSYINIYSLHISTLSQENNVTKPIKFWGGKATIGTAILSFIHAAIDTRDQDVLSRRYLPLPEMAKVLSSVRKKQRNFFFFFFNLMPKTTINGRIYRCFSWLSTKILKVCAYAWFFARVYHVGK
jgi:hypothetical protein